MNMVKTSTTRVIQKGDRVKVHYTTRSLEGCVIESSDNRDPMEFEAGSSEVIRGISQGVIGMKPGESRTFTVSAEHAFGRQQPELIQNAPRTILPEGVSAGDQLKAYVGDVGVDVWVQQVTETEVHIDANHPLAGETLVIELSIVD